MITPEEQIEWDLCKNDCVYFLNKYLQPKKYSPLLADFKLYKFQEEVLAGVESGRLIVINTARQMGISTILTGRALWKMLFNPNYDIALMGPNLGCSIHHISMIRYLYDQLPTIFEGAVEINNKRVFKLKNGSSASAVSGVSVGARSRAFDEVFVDSTSFFNWDHTEFAPVLRPDSKIILSSTLYRKNWFSDMCCQAEEGAFEFTYIKLPYWLHPKRGRAWRSQVAASLGEDHAKIENDCSYIFTAGGELIPLKED